MNDQNLRNALMEIANEEVPEDMDLWNDIQTQLEKPARQQNRFVMTLARVAIAIFALASFSVVGYALYQTIPDQSLNEDIITPLNLSETIDDVTVTLEWAYADVNRIALQYSSEYPQELNPLTFYDIELTDAEGTSIPSAFGGGGGGGGGDNPDQPVSIMANLNFDPTGIINANDDTVDLILQLKVADGQYGVPMFKNDNMQTQGVVPGGVGTGSGGGEGTSADTPPAQEQGGGGGGGGGGFLPTTVPEDAYVREFEIAFTISIYPEMNIDVSDIAPVTDNDITVTLTDLTFTPSSTEANLCFDGIPDETWIPRVTMSNSALPDITTGTQLLPSDEPDCFDVIGFILTNPDVGTITVAVNNLESWADVERPDNSPEAFAARLEERGVYVNLTEMPQGGIMVEIDRERTQMSFEEANEIFQEVQLEQMPQPNVYEGQWVFEVPVN